MNLKAIIEIMRPVNCMMGTLTVMIGILNTRTGIPLDILLLNILLGAVTYYLIAGAGMVINDIYDIEIDKINRPERAIPSGRITMSQAKVIWAVTSIIGFLIALIHSILFSLGFLNVIIVAIFIFVGWFYASFGKKSGFPGNLIVGFSFSIGMVYGAVLNNSVVPNYIYFFFFTSFFLLVSREVIKGAEDVEGDKIEGVKTLAIQIGIKKSSYISQVFAICAIIFFILPMFTDIINPLLFLIPMIFGIIIVGFAVVSYLKKELEKKDLKKISLYLKVGALVGLIAFVFASI